MFFPHFTINTKTTPGRGRFDITIILHITCLKIQKQPPRQFFKISVLFFQEKPFYNFPGGSICSPNRHAFFKEVLSVRRTDLISHRIDTHFPRNPYLVLEHIRIFQEPLFPRRTDIHFLGSPIKSSNTYYFPGDPLYLEQISIFQEGTLSNRYFVIGLGGAFENT